MAGRSPRGREDRVEIARLFESSAQRLTDPRDRGRVRRTLLWRLQAEPMSHAEGTRDERPSRRGKR